MGKANAPLVFKKLLEDPPRLVMTIVKLRDFLFRIVGLKTSDVSNPIKFVELPVERDRPLVAGMDMSYHSQREVIWTLQDKHLTFAISVLVKNAEADEKKLCGVYVSTVLKYHNIWGRAYFFTIRFIHGIVIRSMFKKLMKEL